MSNSTIKNTPPVGGRGASIGLFGGSFNPIHNAHVALARMIREQVGLDEVWFLVSPHNPLKAAEGLINEQERLEMVRLALTDEPGLVASDYEFHLPRPSYTWDTLQHLAHDYPECRFSIIIGGDNWACFDRWAHHEEILRNYRIIVYPREGCSVEKTEEQTNPVFVDTPLINVSSTMIRQLLSNGESASQYLPARVLAYIKQKQLFCDVKA